MRQTRTKFTLIELLVVVAIIGLLISILLPSLRKAKEVGKRAVCLSNIKQCGTAALIYHQNNGRFWSLNNKPYLSTGKSGSRYASEVKSRLLNEYMTYEKNGTEVAIAKCPSDTYYTGVRTDTTAYNLLGTSYCDNMAGNTVRDRGGRSTRSLKLKQMAKVESPDRCLLFMEWPVVSQTYRPDEDFPSWHIKQQYFNVAMVDGSAKYIQILPRQVEAENFCFEYDK
jgi:prepilin-type N-terminal cleavage/methylation domain-containing protein